MSGFHRKPRFQNLIAGITANQAISTKRDFCLKRAKNHNKMLARDAPLTKTQK
jgi:hypothetical protein